MTAAVWHPFDLVARVLAERLRGFEPSAGLRGAFASPTTDWEDVVAEASAEFVLPAFAAAARDLGLTDPLDAELREFLQAVEAAGAERNATLRDELIDVVGRLNRVGIEPVLLKGAIRLVDDLYPGPAWRMMRDLDLLVPEARLEDAVEAVRAAGYGPCPEAGDDDEPSSAEIPHYPALAHRDRLAALELHSELFTRTRRRRLLQAAEVLADSRPVTCEGVTARVPSIDHQVVHLIGHSQISHRGHAYGRVELRDRLEAAALARWSPRRVDWEAVSVRFTAAGCRRPLLTFLLSLNDAGLAAVPTGIHVDALARLQGLRIAVQTRSAAAMRTGSRIGWYLSQLRGLVLEREARRRASLLSLTQIVRGLHRGPPIR